jgi:beta-glucosidase
MDINRRTFLAAAGALAASSPIAAKGEIEPTSRDGFPMGFLWGAASAGHQIEGNNVSSDLWLLENTNPTIFMERSGDAVNSFVLWPTDLDLIRELGLNAYRFSLEWARIEPERGMFSIAMLDYYKAIIGGCRARGITPIVTFNHGTAPRWFAAAGGWSNASNPELFARYCDRAARHLAGSIGYAATLNEPNVPKLTRGLLPQFMINSQRKMLEAAAHACQSDTFVTLLSFSPEDIDRIVPNLLKAHKLGKAAIKAVRSDLPVGFTLALPDDEPAGRGSIRDARRADVYGEWLEAAKEDDFIGVQNYDRLLWGPKGMVPPPKGSKLSPMGGEISPPSLAAAVKYAYEVTHVPVIVTEHGVATDDDTIRAGLIPAALTALRDTIKQGVPVKGYIHWSLLDNFEWMLGYKTHYGLCGVDRTSFKRTPKPSASVLGAIARRNSL